MTSRPAHSKEELTRLRAKFHYWSEKPPLEVPTEAALLFKTDIVMSITIENPRDTRLGQEVRTPVYRVGTLAKMLGKSVQSIRLWERLGYLPDSGILLLGKRRGDERQPKQRCYTYAQLRAVYELLPLLEFGDHRGIRYHPFFREVWTAWMSMPDGIPPEYPEEAPRKGRPRRRRA